MNRKSNPDFPVSGISPLGGNGIESTSDGMAPVRDTTVQEVPLVWDDRVGAHISIQAQEELDDRDADLEREQAYQEEKQFRQKIGMTQT
jgi:hypothetical protein